MIVIKRIYEKDDPADGYRMLVDRLWPRGVSKEEAALNEWNKEIAPSAGLRKCFGHKPELFDEFVQRYKEELFPAKEDILRRIKALADNGCVTLLYGAKDPRMNQAAVLLGILTHLK